jgi:hypothetical protein
MKILAIDNSITSPGIIHCELDDNFDIVEVKYLTFSSTKKFGMKNEYGEVITYSNKDYKGKQFSKIIMVHDEVKKFTKDHTYDYVALEDYAFHGTGDITGLAESCGLLKAHFYNSGSNIRLYSIPSIKKFYAGKGNSDKVDMEDTYEADTNNFKPDLSFLPQVYEKKTGNPKDNLVDAWAILNMLISEIKLRAGIIDMTALTDKQREVFLQSNGKEPNYPARDFITK